MNILEQLDNFSNDEFNEELEYMNPKGIFSKKDVEKKLSTAFALNKSIKVGCDSQEVVLFDEFVAKEIFHYEEIEKIDIFDIQKIELEKVLNIQNIKPNQLIGVSRKILDTLAKKVSQTSH